MKYNVVGSLAFKNLILFVGLFLLAGSCSSNLAPANSNQDTSKATPVIEKKASVSETEKKSVKSTSGNDSLIGKDNFAYAVTKETVGNQAQPIQTQQPSGRTFQQIVEGSKTNQFQTEFSEGQNAIEILKKEHNVETKDFGGGMGEMVLAIDGIRPPGKYFWAFYVNNQFSNVGASSYKVREGDVLEWKLELIK